MTSASVCWRLRQGAMLLEKIRPVEMSERETKSAENMDIFSATLNQIACNLRNIREEDNKTQ
jgi:MarR family transcriptional regulator for hemolysin